MKSTNHDDNTRILAEALPFMQLYDGKIVVIKKGGSAMDEDFSEDFAKDVALLRQSGVKPVIVHGGGKQIDAMLKRLNIKSEFKNGLRVTTKETADIVEMVLAGHINKKIANEINRAGSRAVGIAGCDCNLMAVKKLKSDELQDLGFVGIPDKIDITIIKALVDSDIIPVIAPCTFDDEGQTYNINADNVAGALAIALKATRLVILTDVAGLLDHDGALIPSLSADDAQSLLTKHVAKDGMRVKIETSIQAVRGGVEAAIILDGRKPHALLLELFTAHGVGTMIT